MKKYIGYRETDHAAPWGKFLVEHVAPLLAEALEGLQKSPMPADHLPPLEQAADLLRPGYATVETGYAISPDGSQRVAVLTQMPGVSPAMWHWWFGWHGCLDNRYKLWHPAAHRAARWQDGRDDVAYIGRVSMIEERIGASMEAANIRFLNPAELGLPAQTAHEVFICARLGYTRWPLDFGWLVHHVRAVPGGAEMRSRFWMGGPHIQLRAKWLPGFFSKILQKTVRLPERRAIDLLTHCSEEMNHLARVLPGLYAEFQSA